jgi:hypothetical protein
MVKNAEVITTNLAENRKVLLVCLAHNLSSTFASATISVILRCHNGVD